MKNIIKKILLIIILVLSILLISCGKTEIIDEDTLLITEYNGEEIPLYYIHTEKQETYLSGDYKFATVYAKGQEELSKPNGITIDFSTLVPDNDNYEFYLDTSDNFNNKLTYNTNTKNITLYNLMIKTVYYYQIKSGNTLSVVKAFRVDDNIIRNLNIDGITNARDLGGYKVDGVRIKQGLLYRTSKYNDDESTDRLITDAGINEMVNILKIKTEIDLRKSDENENGGITSSPLGSKVNYVHIPMVSGGNIILLNPDKIADLFKVLGNIDNYPIAFHCSIGTDRTGMVAFLVLNLLGVSKDEVYKDFLFSNFGEIGGMRSTSLIDTYFQMIEEKEGKNNSEKTYNFLLGIGVSKTDLDNFIKIMKK